MPPTPIDASYRCPFFSGSSSRVASPGFARTRSILDTVIAGGPVMIPLFARSVFSVMLVIVYFLTIRRGAVVSSGFMATADALLRKRDYLGLLAVSNRHGEAIAHVVQKVLDFHHQESERGFRSGPRDRGDGGNPRGVELE